MLMKAFYFSSVLFLTPVCLFAQEGSFSGGVTFTSNYISNGETQSKDNPAVQPWLEYELNGFYIGTWWSTVDFEGNDDNVEFDVYVGARGVLDSGFFYDVRYARYLYDDTGDCCGEFLVTLGYGQKDAFAVKAYTAYSPEDDAFNSRLSFVTELTPRFGLSGTYGWREVNNNEYYDLGVAYSINPNVSFDVRYHGAETGFDGVVASLAIFSSGKSFQGMLQKPFQR